MNIHTKRAISVGLARFVFYFYWSLWIFCHIMEYFFIILLLEWRWDHMAVRLKKYSFRFSEELFNSRLAPKSEIEQILYAACVDFSKLNREGLKKIFQFPLLWRYHSSMFQGGICRKIRFGRLRGALKKKSRGSKKRDPAFLPEKRTFFTQNKKRGACRVF